MKLLDLFCGAGGAGEGYRRAGFDVLGVDIAPMPQYPGEVIQGDAMSALADPAFLAEFDAIHASPPCQAYSVTRARTKRDDHPELVGPVRDALRRWGGPYVIENVVGAPLVGAVILCGSMFDLGVDGYVLRRHRLFESNVPLSAPPDACKGRPAVGVYGNGGAWTRTAPGGGGVKVAGPDAARALGIDWTTYQPVLAQAIPPAYTEHLGRQLIAHLGAVAA